MKPTSEAAFETAIEDVLLADGYQTLASEAFDRERAIFSERPWISFVPPKPSPGKSCTPCTAIGPANACWKPCANGWTPMGC